HLLFTEPATTRFSSLSLHDALPILVMFGAFIVSYFSKPLYRSTIQIQIERENPNQLTVEDLFGIASSDQEFMQTQYVLLKSRGRSEEHTSELQSPYDLVCRLLLEKK